MSERERPASGALGDARDRTGSVRHIQTWHRSRLLGTWYLADLGCVQSVSVRANLALFSRGLLAAADKGYTKHEYDYAVEQRIPVHRQSFASPTVAIVIDEKPRIPVALGHRC